jgi:hypothetical protein
MKICQNRVINHPKFTPNQKFCLDSKCKDILYIHTSSSFASASGGKHSSSFFLQKGAFSDTPGMQHLIFLIFKVGPRALGPS